MDGSESKAGAADAAAPKATGRPWRVAYSMEQMQAARSRISTAESEVRALVAERDAARAECARLREALERALTYAESYCRCKDSLVRSDTLRAARAALSGQGGAA